MEFDGYSADVNSVWGLGYAQSEAAQEAALQIAWEMETNGYTVTGKPDLHARRFTFYRERLKANISVQNWNA